MFWHALYLGFKKRFSSPVRGLFGLLLTSIVLKTVQSLEGASINDKVPLMLWVGGLASHFGMETQPLPTYADVYLRSLPQVDVLKVFLDKVRDLDNWKLNLLPVSLNRVDVVAKSICPVSKYSWKAFLWLAVFVRRFCNNAILLLAVMHYLHLHVQLKPDEHVSEKMMLEEPFCKDYGHVIMSLLVTTDYETIWQAFQMGVTLMGGTEPSFGYLLCPWEVMPGPTGEKRLASFARGTVALATYLNTSKSLVEAFGGLHQIVSKTDGFVQYQVDRMIMEYCVSSSQSSLGFTERAFVAGPGMLKVALDMAFDEHFLEDEPARKRQKTCKGKSETRDDEIRRAITVCFFVSSLLVDEPAWHLVCRYYRLAGISIATLQKRHL